MKKVHIDASKSYDVLIGAGLTREVGPRVKSLLDPAACMLAADDRVYELYGESVRRNLENAKIRTVTFTFPHGEQSKNLTTYKALLETMCERQITRTDIVVALGGGVTGDMAGFAAASYQRGIRFVQVPTTLLAMVDSSVGGKTAVDLDGGKNMVGAFCQPSLVLCDTDTLETLPPEEYACGCAEVIKYAMIESEDFFRNLEEKPISEQAEEVIATSVGMKRDYVTRDEFDTGDRVFLNFGHTFGHAIEARSGFSILHGQGVAMGMAAITRAAVKRGLCAPEVEARLTALLKQYALPTEVPYTADELISAALSDKKARGETIRLVVPEKIGRCRVETIPKESLKTWMREGGIA
ncbi:MAG: 3-dehydroquinate synthase [Thermoguttaceae bacterium]|jgi:3-dehydroquinate synthase